MFIFWGRKIVRRSLGYVADFCPICRTQTPFELQRIGSAGHIYYISVGEGSLVGHELLCKECGNSVGIDPARYASVSKSFKSLQELEALTFPAYENVLKERLELERRVQTDLSSLSLEERHALIRSPFLFMSPKVEKRFASTHIDKEVGLSIAATLGLLLFGPGMVSAIAPDQKEVSVLVFLVLGALLVVWQGLKSGSRFFQRQIVPSLAKSLAPLSPTEKELKAVLDELRQVGHKIGKKFSVADLVEHLQAARNLPRP